MKMRANHPLVQGPILQVGIGAARLVPSAYPGRSPRVPKGWSGPS